MQRRLPWVAAAGATVALLVLAPRYGWHRDELYFLQSGRRLAWGYVDQPPFVPLLARVADELRPGSLVAFRAFPALAVGATVLLAAAIARELGGGARAQAIAAVVTATAPLFLGMGHIVSTATFELLLWTVILWRVVRLLRTEEVQLWSDIGLLFALAMLNKHSAVLLAAALAVGIVATPARRLLRTRWLLFAIAVAAALVAPNIVWHAARDWPVLEMLRSLSAESGVEDHVLFVPAQLLQSGPAVVLWFPGLVWLVRDPDLRAFRPIGIAYLVLVVVFVATAGKPYYLAGFYPALIAAGAVGWEERGLGHAGPRLAAIGGAAFAIALALPIAPVEWQRNHPIEDLEYEVGAQLGWEDMVDVIAREVASLGADEKQSLAIYAQNYGQAGAIDLYGPDRGLPRAASPHNNYWWWGPPRETDIAIVVGVPDAWLDDLQFEDCQLAHTFAAPAGVLSEETGSTVRVCRGHKRPWAELWGDLELIAA